MEEIEGKKEPEENQENPAEESDPSEEPVESAPEEPEASSEPDQVEATPAEDEEDADEEVVQSAETVHTRPEPGEPKKRKKVDLESPAEKLRQRAYSLSTGSVRDHEVTRGSGGEVSSESEDTYSTGFILGVALIVLALVAGVVLVRLNSKVNELENRLERIEQALANSGSPAVALHSQGRE